MTDVSLITLVATLIGLIVASAYFSSSETAMMALNRYRLRHLVEQKHRGARRAHDLLRRPDRLIGLILLGNNFVNILAAQIVTVLTLRFVGESSLIVSGLILTAVILVFAEVVPKTLAAVYPERIAVIHGEVRRNWAETQARCHRLADALAGRLHSGR